MKCHEVSWGVVSRRERVVVARHDLVGAVKMKTKTLRN